MVLCADCTALAPPRHAGSAVRLVYQDGWTCAPVFAASGARIRIDPTNGKIVVPTELNACAKVSRLCAVRGGPSRLINGLATIWTSTTPVARMNRATRNSG